MHIYAENRRVPKMREALRAGDFDAWLALVRESGLSSWRLLQNVTPAGAAAEQPMALTLALCERLLEGKGACRVHGGGFAGTAQAYVPLDRAEAFAAGWRPCWARAPASAAASAPSAPRRLSPAAPCSAGY
jgi:galactokinase